jgi:sortase A
MVVPRSTSDTSPSTIAPAAPTLSPAIPEPAAGLSAGGRAPTPPAAVEAQAEPTDSSDLPLPAQPELSHASAPVEDALPITGVTLPRIGLVADVVPAPLAELDDGATWLVPAFKAGHAQYTAGAGQSGNAVVLGHVTSRSLGNVFERLYLGRVGDVVLVSSGPEQVFEYRVVAVQAVSRTDVSVLQPTDTPSISLITCTGDWNAALHDYMERLVVRAELTS